MSTRNFNDDDLNTKFKNDYDIIFDTILKPIMKWSKTGMELDVWLEKPQ